ncbi:MAG: hypothetical protein AAFO07_04120 [Bacteroidota bacterium]
MKFNNLVNKTITYFLLGMFFLVSACEKDLLPDPPTCTFTKDPDCFCQANPNNPLCNIPTCTFESDPDCYCTNAPEDPRCAQACTFEDDPVCFCEENPNDSRCQTTNNPGFHTFFDFEDENLIVDSIFSTGFTGDNPDGWQSDGRAVGSIATGNAAQGDRYFVNEIEVINEAWAWTSNLYKVDTVDASSLAEPTFNFWIRTSNEKPLTAEIALVDDTGESGYHPGGAYAEINGTWQLFSLRLNAINEEGWKWGDNLDFSTINFLKFGFNLNGQTLGDIFEVHVDHIYLDDGVPPGAIAYPAVEVVETQVVSVFTFEEEELIIDSIFTTGFTGDNAEGWQSDGRAVASIVEGDAPEGSKYFSNEIEVINEAWAWTSNLAKEEAFDLSAMTDPTFNFWIRTSNEKAATIEFGIVDDSGESGWHPGGAYAEINGDWQLISINLTELNNIGWQWGDGLDFSQISLIKFGFNLNGQTLGDIFEVHVDHIHFADGAPEGAIIYPAPPEPSYERVFTWFDFESADIIVDSIFTSGFTGDNEEGWQSDGRAVGSIVEGEAPEGTKYFSNEIEVINEAWAWTSNLFSEDIVDASSADDPTLNFWIRTSNNSAATIEFAMVDDSGESGWHPGGAYAEINDTWQQISVRLNDLNWQWGDGLDYSQISLLKFGFNLNGQTQGDIFEVHVDDIHIGNGSPDGAIIYPKQ